MMKRVVLLCACIFFLAACNQNTKVADAGANAVPTNEAKATPASAKKEVSEMVNLNIGDAVPMADAKMKNIDGNDVAISDAKKDNGVLILFSCNTCPYVIAWEDRYDDISDYCDKNNIGLLVVNSNEARRDGDDSMEEMQKHAKENNFTFPYVIDANSTLADAMGARKTPDLFLFDKDLKLVYKGAIDDNHKDQSEVKQKWVNNAMMNLVKGSPIDPNTTKSVGCSIKRIKKS